MNKTAEERAGELMCTPIKNLPSVALKYRNFLCKELGGCGEVMYVAFVHYARAVEKLPIRDKSNNLDKRAINWFEKNWCGTDGDHSHYI